MFTQSLSIITKTGSLTSDIIILLILLVIFTVLFAYLGKTKIVTLIISFYPAVFFYQHLPFLNKLIILHGDGMILFNKIFIFLVLLVVFSIIIGRHVFSDSGYVGISAMTRVIAPSLGVIILILVFSYSVIDLSPLHTFSASIGNLFSSATKIFWWGLVPIGLLLF